MTSRTESAQRLRAQSAEIKLAEAIALIVDLQEQLTRANQAAARMARRIPFAQREAA